LSKTVKRLKEWFKGYDDAPLWLCFCRLIFAVSTLAFIVSFFGPAILGGDLIGFWMYQKWSLTHAGFLYIIVIVVTFTLAVISGIPSFLYEKKKMKLRENEAEK
jgi:predicted small integral membrane protein